LGSFGKKAFSEEWLFLRLKVDEGCFHGIRVIRAGCGLRRRGFYVIDLVAVSVIFEVGERGCPEPVFGLEGSEK
jgi:hypothetical protein